MAEIAVNELAPKVASALTTADQVTTFTQDGDTNRTSLFEAVAKANEENGCLCIKTAKLDIPSAEVLTLNSVPKPFGITVPAGYYVQPIAGSFRATNGTTAYDTNVQLAARFIGADTNISNSTANWVRALQSTVDRSGVLPFDAAIGATTSDTQVLPATDIEIYVVGGDPLNGDSDITIYLTYMLIEL